MMAACTKKQRVDECIDRISNLHECLILRILSCLPTKDAMRTSVLSKKWINLWTLISNLYFDDSGFSPTKRQKGSFVKFVNRVLLHHSNSTIQSFKLIALDCYDTHQCYVDAWITAALNQQVQKLHIDYMWSTNISPHSLFQCQSLVELKLKLPMCQLRILASVCLPNLKFLSLSRISLKSYSSFPFRSDFSTLKEEVTLSFPVLRVFKSKGCGWLMQNVCLHVPLLERLVFSVSNLDFFSLKSFARTFKICTSRPKVFAFKIEDGFHHLKGIVKDIVLSDPSSSSEATLEISGKATFDKVRFSSPVCMLLKQFNQMRYLKFGNVQIPFWAKDDFVNLPEFKNVRQLQIGKVSGEILLGLLLKLPILETLVLNKELSEFDKMVLDSASLPHCVVSSLKVVKFGVLDGKEHELSLAKFLMENGAVLEQMSFSLSQTLKNDSSKTAVEKIKRQLLSFEKCSSFSFIKFSDV
ncbi:hypothetical protein L6164_022723 [Bauhinia variegata]|uniref:Uncharacterized protein n=1 Tax=Bauhinia variegata TaxID=167791 RepID=A0ACB9MHD9_BAUVA|nr:hypothetical protein L6164_022723 [Bauhinia variegata]